MPPSSSPDAGEGQSICHKVASDGPVIVERPTYFNFDGIWDGGSDGVGTYLLYHRHSGAAI